MKFQLFKNSYFDSPNPKPPSRRLYPPSRKMLCKGQKTAGNFKASQKPSRFFSRLAAGKTPAMEHANSCKYKVFTLAAKSIVTFVYRLTSLDLLKLAC